MTQPNPYQPIFTGVEQVKAALDNFASRQGSRKPFVGTVKNQMDSILAEVGKGPGRPLHEVEVDMVEHLADELNELAMYLTAAQQGGPGTDVSLEQEHALMHRVRSAVWVIQSMTNPS